MRATTFHSGANAVAAGWVPTQRGAPAVEQIAQRLNDVDTWLPTGCRLQTPVITDTDRNIAGTQTRLIDFNAHIDLRQFEQDIQQVTHGVTVPTTKIICLARFSTI